MNYTEYGMFFRNKSTNEYELFAVEKDSCVAKSKGKRNIINLEDQYDIEDYQILQRGVIEIREDWEINNDYQKLKKMRKEGNYSVEVKEGIYVHKGDIVFVKNKENKESDQKISYLPYQIFEFLQEKEGLYMMLYQAEDINFFGIIEKNRFLKVPFSELGKTVFSMEQIQGPTEDKREMEDILEAEDFICSFLEKNHYSFSIEELLNLYARYKEGRCISFSARGCILACEPYLKKLDRRNNHGIV